MHSKILITLIGLCLLGWVLFFQAPTPVSSSPLLGITLTPTRVVPPVTLTPTEPPQRSTEVPPTLPPPPEKTPLVIPVTGVDSTPDLSGAVNLGLACLGLGLIFAGMVLRKK